MKAESYTQQYINYLHVLEISDSGLLTITDESLTIEEHVCVFYHTHGIKSEYNGNMTDRVKPLYPVFTHEHDTVSSPTVQ